MTRGRGAAGGKKADKPEGHGDEEYARCVAAWERLLAQDPEDNRLECDELRELLEDAGRVPVTQDNVAKEAGVPRKALTAGGRFEQLGARIKAGRSSHGVAPTTSATLSRLRTDLKEARQTIVVLRSKMAEAVLRADASERLLAEERKHVGRLRQQIAGRR